MIIDLRVDDDDDFFSDAGAPEAGFLAIGLLAIELAMTARSMVRRGLCLWTSPVRMDFRVAKRRFCGCADRSSEMWVEGPFRAERVSCEELVLEV